MRRSLSLLLCGALVVAALTTAGSAAADPASRVVPGDPLTGSGVTARTALTAAELSSRTSPTSTIANDAFALPAGAARPKHTFEGRLTLKGVETSGGFSALKDPYGYATLPAMKHLPPFSVQLVQTGSHLVPVVRGVQYTGSPYWNLAVGAGRAWSEKRDRGQTRASLPFALIERNANCVHNGVLTFLFSKKGISNVRYQVTSETCEYFQFDLFGQVDATYDPGGVKGAARIRTAYAAEVADRLPTKPISALTTDHPDADIDLSAFGGGITPSALSTFGFVYGGVNYVGDCPTRQGAYPFCSQLLLPSYSTAKSVLGGMALLRLAEKYGPEIAQEPLNAHIPQATGAAWDGVTIGHALDMTTGNYASPTYEADEAGATMSQFFLAETYTEKLTAALSFPRRSAPGSIWTYHTSDTFLAVQAMNDILKEREGADSDIFAMLRDEVLAPAKVGPDALSTLRTDNSPQGAPFGGYGMFWTRDDIAKVAKLLVVDHGAVDGEQVLHAGLLDSSLQRDPRDRGSTTTGAVPFRYNNGFWSREFSTADDAAFAAPFSVPFMSGFGGITVALMPNGSSYYVFSDNNEFSWVDVVAESNRISPMPGG